MKGKKKTTKTTRISRRDRTRGHEAQIAYIHNQIRSGGFPTTTQLAQDLCISPRAVKRHIRAMKTYRGLPIKTSRKAGQEGYYYETPVAPLIGRTFTETEVVKLFMGHNLLDKPGRLFASMSLMVHELPILLRWVAATAPST